MMFLTLRPCYVCYEAFGILSSLNFCGISAMFFNCLVQSECSKAIGIGVAYYGSISRLKFETMIDCLSKFQK